MKFVPTAAKVFIWSFFLLICSHALEFAAVKLGVPLRPAPFYAVIAVGLFISATLISRNLEDLKGARAYFLVYIAIVALGAVMYRGENFGPDFGQKILVPFHIPSSIGYVVWPTLNLFASAGLYLLAYREEYRRTIILAAFVSLLMQIATMESDMWWEAIFGEVNGRAGGFASNANEAALLVSVLASLMLPAFLGERFNRFAVCAVMLAVAGVLFSQSRAGLIFAGIVVACFVAIKRKMPLQRPSQAFVLGYAAVILVTLFLSPVLNATEDQIRARNVRHAEAVKKTIRADPQETTPQSIGDPNPDGVVKMSEPIPSRFSLDSINPRRQALSFYAAIVRDYPTGMGAGFTNKFAVGPHNEWLKLAVDYGIAAPLLLAALLGAVTWRALKTRSPALFSIASIAWVSSMFYHTLIVDPIIPVALAVGLGLSSRPNRAQCDSCR